METSPDAPLPGAETQSVETVVIRFAGDSGDGMQVTGSQFTSTTAILGNDLSTLPDFPAEIRAPAGSLPGVSGFQIQFSSRDVSTPGDAPDVLVAMNPAALRVNIRDLKMGGALIVNTGAFTENNLQKAGYRANPLDDGSLKSFQIFSVDISKLTALALEDLGLSQKEVQRCKNFFALGMMYWLYHRPLDHTLVWIEEKFGKKPEIAEANRRALKKGFHYGETAEIFHTRYEVKAAEIRPGTYRNITGNSATALGLVAAARQSGLKLFLGSYPITPASDVLHELSMYRHFGVTTFQAEDEIAGVGAAIGAAFGGAIGVTTTSGPGVALKTEAIGLAVMTELPVVVINIQRGGPSTGLPTKTEQADLLQAVYGRNGEAPVPVLAAATPSDCFWMAMEAVRIALTYMTPVILLTDGYLANGAEPWLLPEVSDLPKIRVEFAKDPATFAPYSRNADTLARPWAVPGTPGLEHRIGGLEKEDGTGNVSYDPENHDKMCRLRAAKVAGIAKTLPPQRVEGDAQGDLLVLGWGSTYGAIAQAVAQCRAKGLRVGHAHLRHLNPLPRDLGEILPRFRRVLIPEMNLGQLSKIVRATYLVDAIGLNKVQGKPFKISEIVEKIEELAG